jgi:hypothetical protein
MKKAQQNQFISLSILKVTLYVVDLLLFVLLISNSIIRFPKAMTPPKVIDTVITIQDNSQDTSTEELSFLSQRNIPCKPLSEREIIDTYVDNICSMYNVDPALVRSIIQQESGYGQTVSNGSCVGLMQVSTYWHADRAARLGVTDFYNAYSNILVGVDYLSELLTSCDDTALALMFYSMNHNTARKMHDAGQISTYAKTVLTRAEEYRKGGS